MVSTITKAQRPSGFEGTSNSVPQEVICGGSMIFHLVYTEVMPGDIMSKDLTSQVP